MVKSISINMRRKSGRYLDKGVTYIMEVHDSEFYILYLTNITHGNTDYPFKYRVLRMGKFKSDMYNDWIVKSFVSSWHNYMVGWL